MMLTSRFEMWLGSGEDLWFFYNDAYIPSRIRARAVARRPRAIDVDRRSLAGKLPRLMNLAHWVV